MTTCHFKVCYSFFLVAALSFFAACSESTTAAAEEESSTSKTKILSSSSKKELSSSSKKKVSSSSNKSNALQTPDVDPCTSKAEYPNTYSPDTSKFLKVAGCVTTAENKLLPNAKVYLTAVDTSTHHAYYIDSTTTDDNGRFLFDPNIDWKTKVKRTFNVLVKAEYQGDSLFAFDNDYFSNFDDEKTDTLSFKMRAGKYATLALSTIKEYELYNSDIEAYADSICYGGNFVCASFTPKDFENKNFVIVQNVPPGKIGNVDIWFGGKVTSILTSRTIEPREDTLFLSLIGGYTQEKIHITLPDEAVKMLESKGLDPQIEGMILPIHASSTYASKRRSTYDFGFNRLLDGVGYEVSLIEAENDTDSTRFWGIYSTLRKDTPESRWLDVTYVTRDHYSLPTGSYLYATAAPGLTLKDTIYTKKIVTSQSCVVFSRSSNTVKAAPSNNCRILDTYESRDTSFLASFWIDTGANKNSKKILSVGTKLGFTMEQCENDAKSICTKFNTGTDASNKTYGKTKIFDGKKHHVSLGLHGKHLAIAIDGNIVEDTDLALSQEFYENSVSGIKVGDFTLSDFLIHSFGNNIKKPKDEDWSRMHAWLKAFYLLQK